MQRASEPSWRAGGSMCRFYHREKSLSPNVKSYPIPTPGPTSRAAPAGGLEIVMGQRQRTRRKLRAKEAID